MQMNNLTRRDGFTLLQLSITLTIIALLVSGVLLGRHLIRRAEVMQVATGFIKYRDAIKQFQDKYKYLPGDLPTATSFWGASATCGDPTNDYKVETCNGNGDGQVDDASDLIYLTAPAESIYLWQHLTNSKFLEGTYTGEWALGTSIWKPGVNIPKGLDNAGYAFYYTTHITTVVAYAVLDSNYTEGAGNVIGATFPANYNHVISFGKASNGDGTEHPPMGMTLSPSDAYSIDLKFDDGKPALGKILSTVIINGGSYYCVTNTTPAATITYSTTNDGKYCILFFITGL